MIGRIYKIVHTQSNICYVGMTTSTLKQRWFCHKSDYNKNNNSCASIYQYMRKYGIEQFKILLIKEYEVIDKNHLKVYETLWMKKLKSINEKQSFNPLNKKQKDHLTYLRHREERILKVKKYADANKDKISKRGKQYREKNYEKIKEQKKVKVICECGGSWTKGHGFKRHEATKKHQNYINNK